MEDSDEGVEISEEVILQLGNQILAVLGADEPIHDLAPFTDDTLYIELFKGLFDHMPLDDMQPGETLEEKANNLRTLRDLLGQTVVNADLSYISATAILKGDLSHLGEFLQILMQIIAALAEGDEGEGEMMPSSAQKSGGMDMEYDEENKTDTQKLKAGLGLSSPGDENDEDDRMQEEILKEIQKEDLKNKNKQKQKEEQKLDEASSPDMEHEGSPLFDKSTPLKDNQKPNEFKKQEVDVLRDPLFPEEGPSSSGKRRPRAGSFGEKEKRHAFDEDEDDDNGIAFDQLDDEQKLEVLQHLYEEYQRDPDSFPEEQRILLEEQLKIMIDQGLIEGFEENEESETDERMKAKGQINFPSEPLPIKTDDEDKVEIDKGGQELDVQEIDMKKKREQVKEKAKVKEQNYLLPGEEDKHEEIQKASQKKEDEDILQHEEADEEAEIIQSDHHMKPEETGTPDIGDYAKFELL